MNNSALFLSPHLDDVAFSCGGTLIGLVSQGWSVTLCTVFTASVLRPTEFALACQLDKGLAAEVDYMAIRRNEDLCFASMTNVKDCLHLPFQEAPLRGYESAADLFAGAHDSDQVWRKLAVDLATIAQPFSWIFAPQGLGNHVDHLQTILALQAAGLSERTLWYRDTPYAIRNPDAQPAPSLPARLSFQQFQIDLQKKIAACAVYKTQIPFQFGSSLLLAEKLRQFHGTVPGYSESFLCSTDANTSPLQFRTITRGI